MRKLFTAVVAALSLGYSVPSLAFEEPVSATATAYCQAGITRSGIHTRVGIIAADPRWLPVGSIVTIIDAGSLTGSYAVMDTGAAVKGHHVDVFVPSCARAKRIGR